MVIQFPKTNCRILPVGNKRELQERILTLELQVQALEKERDELVDDNASLESSLNDAPGEEEYSQATIALEQIDKECEEVLYQHKYLSVKPTCEELVKVIHSISQECSR